jgi:hypothetical protein
MFFEPFIAMFGKIYPASGYRSGALNEAIGGSVTSLHLTGAAVDFETELDDLVVIRRLAEEPLLPMTWDRLAWYRDKRRFHVDFNAPHLKQRECFYIGPEWIRKSKVDILQLAHDEEDRRNGKAQES